MKIASKEFTNSEEYYQTIIISLLSKMLGPDLKAAWITDDDLKSVEKHIVQVDHGQTMTTFKLIEAEELDKQRAREYFDRKPKVTYRKVATANWQNP